jgi:hypothetical protein
VFANSGFFGRMDVCTILCRIRKKKLSIVELNGAASEPTHYDPSIPHFCMEGISDIIIPYV